MRVRVIETTVVEKHQFNDNRKEESSLRNPPYALMGHPNVFLNTYKMLAAQSDGFIGRLLLCSIQPSLYYLKEVEAWNTKLEEYKLHSFHSEKKLLYFYAKFITAREETLYYVAGYITFSLKKNVKQKLFSNSKATISPMETWCCKGVTIVTS